MKDIMNTMIIFLKYDEVFIQIVGKSASYRNSGNIQAFTITNKNKLPQSIIINDFRSEKSTVKELDKKY